MFAIPGCGPVDGGGPVGAAGLGGGWPWPVTFPIFCGAAAADGGFGAAAGCLMPGFGAILAAAPAIAAFAAAAVRACSCTPRAFAALCAGVWTAPPIPPPGACPSLLRFAASVNSLACRSTFAFAISAAFAFPASSFCACALCLACINQAATKSGSSHSNHC